MQQDINNLGTYANISAVWAAYPEGGQEGDYLYIGSTKYRWNKYDQIWENASTVTEGTARKLTELFADVAVNNDLRVGGTLYYHRLKGYDLGLYSTLASLEAEHPSPEVGMWAFVVHPTISGKYQVYQCSTAGEWTLSVSETTLDILDFERYEEAIALMQEIANGRALTGYRAAQSVSDLPTEDVDPTLGWIVGNHLYVWVGEGGDTLGGLYQNCGELRGEKGEKGDKGLDGVVLDPEAVTIDEKPIDGSDDLVKSGGVYTALSAKIGGSGELNIDGDSPSLVLNAEGVSADDFTSMLSVNADGTTQVMSPSNQNLGNTTSSILDIDDLTITPLVDDVIFKVSYYDDGGTFLNATPYMAKSTNAYVTAQNVVEYYTISSAHCRITLAHTTLQTGTRDKSEALAKVTFTGSSAYVDNSFHLLTFDSADGFTADTFRAFAPIKKVSGKWVADFDIHTKIIPSSTTAFVATNGVDTNDGLSPLTPVKTIGKAATLADTIILASGTYTNGTHFTSGMTLSGKNVIADGEVTIDCGNAAPINVTGNAYIEGVKFVNGNDGSLKVVLTSTSLVCALNRCEFNDSVGSSYGGLVVQGGTIYVVDCVANGNIKDGFNYHKTSGNVIPHVLEIGCKAFNNGNADSYNSNNATTAHDGCKISRVGGVYGYCKGGVLADVNSGTISFNYGCTILSSSLKQSSSADIPFMASVYCGSAAQIHLIDCAITGSKYAISSNDSNSIVYTDTTYSNNYTSGGGTIVNV